MENLILILHVVVCVILVILVLLQAGREGMGVIFGGGNTSVFGSTGAGGLLTKLTAFMAVLFVFTCLSYNLLTSTGKKQESSILDVRLEDTAPAATPAPVLTPTPEAPKTETPAPTTSDPATTAPAATAPATEAPKAE